MIGVLCHKPKAINNGKGIQVLKNQEKQKEERGEFLRHSVGGKNIQMILLTYSHIYHFILFKIISHFILAI